MNHRIACLSLVAAATFVATAFCESVKLTNGEATRLFAALRATQHGLTPVNTTRAAVNINALRPYVEAYETTQRATATKMEAIPENDPERTIKIARGQADLLAVSKDVVTVDLRPVVITEDDAQIRDAKIPPDALAEFLRFLQPQPAAQEKKK